MLAGAADFLLEIVVPDIAAYKQLLFQTLRRTRRLLEHFNRARQTPPMLADTQTSRFQIWVLHFDSAAHNDGFAAALSVDPEAEPLKNK